MEYFVANRTAQVFTVYILKGLGSKTRLATRWLGFGRAESASAGFQPQVSRKHRIPPFPLEPGFSWRNICDSCSSGRDFACSFLQIPGSPGHFYRPAIASHYQGPKRTFISKSPFDHHSQTDGAFEPRVMPGAPTKEPAKAGSLPSKGFY